MMIKLPDKDTSRRAEVFLSLQPENFFHQFKLLSLRSFNMYHVSVKCHIISNQWNNSRDTEKKVRCTGTFVR